MEILQSLKDQLVQAAIQQLSQEFKNKSEWSTKANAALIAAQPDTLSQVCHILSDKECPIDLQAEFIPAIISLYMTSPSPVVKATAVLMYNNALEHGTKETYKYPSMANPSVFYTPQTTKVKSFTKQNLSELNEFVTDDVYGSPLESSRKTFWTIKQPR